MDFSPETILSLNANFKLSLFFALIAFALTLYAQPWGKGFRFNLPILRIIHKYRYAFATILILGMISAVGFDLFFKDLPDINQVALIGPVSSKIMDKNGNILYEVHGEVKRTPVPLSEISKDLINATVAIEDKDFYKHEGVSLTAIARAAYENYKSDRITQGGSTITQQLVKLTVLTSEKTYERKIKEAVLALMLEDKYTKDQILEMYLNRVPYGRNTYGIEAASLAYFAKHAKDLSLAESAYLASLPKAPSLYSPSGATPTELEFRKNQVLTAMDEMDYIYHFQAEEAKKAQVTFTKTKTELAAPYFVKWVEGALEQQYGRKFLEEEGLEIQTSLDSNLQKIAERVVEEGAKTNSARYNAHNAALVAINPSSGYILAMVGGKDYFGQAEPAGCKSGINCVFDPQTNVATSLRQPGSSFKPYTYVTAFTEQFRYSPSSKILDRSQNFSQNQVPYRPVNYSGKEYGLITMRQALAGSLNIAAVRTLSQIGVKPVVNTVQSLGITSPMDSCGLSLTLGACEVKLVEHVAAFSVFANMGKKANVSPILKVTDKRGRILYQHKPDLIQVINPQATYQLVDIMSDNNARSYVFGPRSPLVLPDRKVAAKTGTSQDFKDGWTVGFTPQLATGVWVGNNDGRLMRPGADGVVVAAPIWNKFMKEAMNNVPAEDFQIPKGIQRVRISAGSGRLAGEFTPDAVYEVFADYSVPRQRDTSRPIIAIEELPDIGGSSEPTHDEATLPSWAQEIKEVSNRKRTAP